MTKVHAVIFDFDGVLVDSEVISLSELQRSLAFYGIERHWDELVDGFLGHSSQSIGRYIESETGKALGEEFPDLWTNRILQRFSTDLTLMPGIEQFLDQLDQKGISFCIASGSSRERLAFALEVVGLTDRFSGRAFSTDLVEKGKPAPDIFHYALDAMNVSASEAVVIEDGISGVVGAKTAGISSVFGFVGGAHLENRADQHGIKLSRAGADPIASRLADFEQHLFD